jgi:hypothetical protein
MNTYNNIMKMIFLADKSTDLSAEEREWVDVVFEYMHESGDVCATRSLEDFQEEEDYFSSENAYKKFVERATNLYNRLTGSDTEEISTIPELMQLVREGQRCERAKLSDKKDKSTLKKARDIVLDILEDVDTETLDEMENGAHEKTLELYKKIYEERPETPPTKRARIADAVSKTAVETSAAGVPSEVKWPRTFTLEELCKPRELTEDEIAEREAIHKIREKMSRALNAAVDAVAKKV